MIVPVACVLYTQDSDLVRRTHAYLRSLAQVRHVGQAERLEAVLSRIGRPCSCSICAARKVTIC
jgi:hypothetical protein